jgi:mono/diheme cytochrome c family protein
MVRCVVGAVGLLLAVAASAAAGGDEDEALTNPYLGDPEAIANGLRFYRGRCILCHPRRGGRGPNLFTGRLSDEQFLEVVINGREGTLMPAFGLKMSPDDVWQVHAFVSSRDSY